MPVTINWTTKVIKVGADLMTLQSGAGGPGSLYQLDVNQFRLALKDIEDGEGMPYLDTHRHNSPVLLGGVTYARTFEIINGYTVEFDEATLDHCTVLCVGANHNIADVKVLNTVSLIVGNAAGLIVVSSGSGLSPTEQTKLDEIHKIHGLQSGIPLVVGPTTRTAGTVEQTITEDGGGTTTVERV
jgi:hypothetical protein